MKANGRISARLKLGTVDKDLDLLVVSKLKAEMVFGLRSLKEKMMHIDFQPRLSFPVYRNKRGFQSSHTLSATQCIPKADSLELP